MARRAVNPVRGRRRFWPPRGFCVLFLLVLTGLWVSVMNVQAQFQTENWTTDDGLPQNSVNALVQTRDGYLWMATFDGLVRFDGVRFTVFNKANTPGIGFNRFSRLVEGEDGALWAMTERGEIVRGANGRFETIAPPEGTAVVPLPFLSSGPGTGVIASYPNCCVTFHEGKTEVESGAFLRVAGRSGAVWTVTDGAVTKRVGGREVLRLKPDTAYGGDLIALEDAAGRLWIASSIKNLLVRCGPDGARRFDFEKWGSPRSVKALFQDRDGKMWIGFGRDGLIRFDGDTLFENDGAPEFLHRAPGFAASPVNAVTQDREGNLWLGSNARGLFRLSPQWLTPFSAPELTISNVYPVFEDADGSMWIGGEGGVAHVSDGRVTLFKTPNIQTIHRRRSGQLWLGGIGGMFVLADGTLKQTTPDGQFPPFAMGYALLEAADGTLWVGTGQGLWAFPESGASRRYVVADGLAGDEIRAIHQDRRGDLWFGSTSGLTRLKDGTFTRFRQADGLASDYVRAIHEEPDGTLWLGTYDNGLTRFRDGKFSSVTPRDGLIDGGAFRILEDAAGFFWLSGNRGIQRVEKRQLVDFIEGKLPRVNAVLYGKGDGMPSSECNGGGQPAGVRARDGRLWFPTQRGVVVIAPGAVPTNRLPPNVLIEEISVERRPVEAAAGLTLAPGQGNVEFRFTGTSFIRPNQVSFRYRLRGLNDAWADLGARRSVGFAYLPPGDYTFEVMAANSDGVWNPVPATVRLTVVPPFYRRWQFLAVVAVVIAGAGYAGYRRRVRALVREAAVKEAFSRKLIESQEIERKRIAAELHDSLGQSLAVIKNRAMLAIEDAKKGESTADQLGHIVEQSASAIAEARAIAYNLRPYLLDRLGLTLALRALVKDVAESSGIGIEADIAELADVLDRAREMNLYRIVQECLGNIVKHSRAATATVTITRDGQRISVRISDDGTGFLPKSDPPDGARGGGFGLLGIAERIRLLGASPVIQGEVGEGVTVAFEIMNYEL